ncbi:MAG: dihydroorotase [Treponema sp.]|jgi:dihydroorotase|nr:dihydroorotase [Treponema sp.]
MTLLHGARVLDPVSRVDETGDIIIKGDRILERGQFDPHGNWDAVYDCRGLAAAPGFIDLHVHFRDPGFTWKEDLHSGARAAAAGGFTTVVCMANTSPPMDRPERVEAFLRRAEGEAIRVLTAGAVTEGLAGRRLAPLRDLAAAGAVSLSDDGNTLQDPALLRRALLEAREAGLPVFLHEEDRAYIGTAGVNEGKVSKMMGLSGARDAAESSLVARDAALSRETGARVHFQHLSARASVEALRRAKEESAPVSAEVTPHHLGLTEDAMLEWGTLAKVNPPLRTERDRRSLIQGIASGLIDCIATDHAPHSAAEKALPFCEAPSGIAGLETAFSAALAALVREGPLSLSELVYRLSAAPAALLGLPGGALAAGAPADITVFDPEEEWLCAAFESKSENSPWKGRPLRGRVKYTFCRGRLVWPAV